jgi:hypothetical protein
VNGSGICLNPFKSEDELNEICPLRCPALKNSIEEESECSICQEKTLKMQLCRELPCKHLFHSYCIDPWLLGRSATCPLCRLDVVYPKSNNADTSSDLNNTE